RRNGVKVELNCTVRDIILTNQQPKSGHNAHTYTIQTNNGIYHADAIIIATGGLSYPSTGSTGDGYHFATILGHTIKPTYPSLVPLIVKEPWVADLTGLSLRNVTCTARMGKKILYEEMGEMLFTPTGITGPIILRASAFLTEKLHRESSNSKTGKLQSSESPNFKTEKPATDTPITIEIDLKPALTHEQLDARILRDFSENKNKNFVNALNDLLPQRLITIIISLSKISPDKKVNTITRQERQNLTTILKALPLTPTKTTGYKEAVITKGGISVKEINPSTMMSKLHPGLFFAGEVLDVDAMTGGYNLQIAFSTGYLAGHSATKPQP
ncbi:MAG: NAD(P)/FAD-dependent oxidoreductase, partial [Defluviitaleaceae bacterium]|nr:NAD(P)/FAD-dependent oxidoreductase [Defluviitaleaceae bacterium]